MRLIDADALRQAVTTDYYEHYTKYHDSDQIALINMVEYDIEELETIDPETLPIVQELKEQLAKVTAERDAAVDSLENICMYGDPPCKYCHEQGKCLFNDSPEYCINFYWEGFPKLFDKFNEV